MKYTPDKEVLYEIIGILSNADLPLVFKGANVTNILLQQSNSPYVRRTTDIDSSWNGINPTTENIESMLKKALNPYGYDVSKIRDLNGVHVSAGFKVLKNGLPVTKMDIDIHKSSQCEKYSIGTVTFNGVIAEEILADKLCAISNQHIYRRIKDLMDIYSLTDAVDINTKHLFEIIKQSDHQLGDFEEFTNNKGKIREAYLTLKVSNKPEFDKVYECVFNFMKEIKEYKKETEKTEIKDIADDFDNIDM